MAREQKEKPDYRQEVTDRIIALMENGTILTVKPTKELFASPGTVAGAVLTGCKNVATAVKTGEHEVEVPGWGAVKGDIAWGGNWFFLINGQGPEVCFARLAELTDFTWSVRTALARQGGGPIAIRTDTGSAWRYDARTRWHRLAENISSVAYGG